MSYDAAFGLRGNGLYGYDSVGVSFASGGNDNVTLDRQVLAAYETHDYWLGQVGLSQFAITMNEAEHPKSFLTALKEQGHIPSLSFGYQAGASHGKSILTESPPSCDTADVFSVYTKIPGSLILGGYDESRRSIDSLPFSSLDNVQVGLQRIVATTDDTTVTLLDKGIIALIDTAVPEIWLPPSTCDEIASAFGLTYHNASDRYVLTTIAHNALEKSNPSIKFELGTSVSGGSTVLIEVPYKAFDLEASYPIYASPTKYFPLRRAVNESQYALGRAFLQHVYIVVDWERDTFNLSQALFSAPMPEPNIITIPPKLSRTQVEDGQRTDTLPVGAIVGIAIGCALALLGTILACWLWRRTRSRQKAAAYPSVFQGTDPSKISEKDSPSELALGNGQRSGAGAELEGDRYHLPEMASPHTRRKAYELAHGAGERQLIEMETPNIVYELSDTNDARRIIELPTPQRS